MKRKHSKKDIKKYLLDPMKELAKSMEKKFGVKVDVFMLPGCSSCFYGIRLDDGKGN